MRPTLLLLVSSAAAGPLASIACQAACGASLMICLEVLGPVGLACSGIWSECVAACGVTLVLPTP